MATNSKPCERHFLFHGELSDAPGRDESWDEYVRYRGDSRWELTIEGTDFVGAEPAEPVKEAMSTKALVEWALERDAEMDDAETAADDDSDGDQESGPRRRLGPRAERLREIAVSEGATYCVTRLDRWLKGSWPRDERRTVRILDVKGVTKRGVWIRVYHTVYEVETSLGPGFLYPPEADREAKLVLKSEPSMSMGQTLKVPMALMAKIEALRPRFEALDADRG